MRQKLIRRQKSKRKSRKNRKRERRKSRKSRKSKKSMSPKLKFTKTEMSQNPQNQSVKINP